MIERCTSLGQPEWLSLREALWPHCSHEEHLAETASFLAELAKYAHFVAYSEAAAPIGFVEASLRSEYVNGTSISPVVFLKGLYVVPQKYSVRVLLPEQRSVENA
jgi:aminoglycoside 6'-N-acetyltransferase I